MAYFLTSDWHLGHQRIVELAHRPADFEERIAYYIHRYIEGMAMQRGDILIHLGDVALYRDGIDKATKLLNGIEAAGITSLVLRGNHDGSDGQLLSMGFRIVGEELVLKKFGKTILFSHEPIVEPRQGVSVNIHGHIHHPGDTHRGGPIHDGKHILISQEVLGYRPISLERTLEIGTTPAYELGRFVKYTPKEEEGKEAIMTDR
jgi:calcineurin-like phosphoesterase family protein